jgi:cation transport regulator ChaC
MSDPMSDQWYFAYGSNLSREQKVNRTGPIREERRARLDGYRLAFNKRGTDGTGKANIVPDEGGTVWGVVYRCSPSALNEMDRHEGVSGGHYVRKTVRVRADDGEELDAVTYVAGSAYIDNSLTPSSEYLQTILRGAREHALPDEYVRGVEALGRQGNAGDQDRPA